MTYDETLEKAIALTVDLNGKHPGESGHDPTRPKQYGYQPVIYIGVPNFVYSRGGEVIDSGGRPSSKMPRRLKDGRGRRLEPQRSCISESSVCYGGDRVPTR